MEYSISNILLIGDSISERMDGVNAYVAAHKSYGNIEAKFTQAMKLFFPNEAQPNSNVSRFFEQIAKHEIQYAICHFSEQYSMLVAEHYSWDSILHEATDLAQTCNGRILAIGTKQFDFLVMYVFNEGKLLSSHIVGTFEEPYFDVTPIGDPAIFASVLGLDLSSVDQILNHTDYEDQIDELSKLLGIDLVQNINKAMMENPSDHPFEFF
jgi:hypothetical protein